MQRPKQVALVTNSKFPDLCPSKEIGDTLLIPALRKLNITAVPEIWSDESVQWSKYDMVIIRSTWDYQLELEEFKKWLLKVQSNVFNSFSIVMWNIDKKYLLDLAKHGCLIPPSVFVEAQSPMTSDIKSIMAESGWDKCIVKPTVGANSEDVFYLKSIEEASERQAELAQVFENRAFIVQKYIPEIASEGEWSLCFYGGKFSYAVLCSPTLDPDILRRSGQYKFESLEPPAAVLEAGQKVMSYFNGEYVLYCRVDLLHRKNGEVFIVEVEAIEPSMFLGCDRGYFCRRNCKSS